MGHTTTASMLLTYLLLTLCIATLARGQCQTPGNALCWLAEEDLIVGDPCCAGSFCLPHPDDSINSFCQYIERIPEGGFCGDRVGICEDGTVCIDDTCTKGTAASTTPTTTPTTTPSSGGGGDTADCAATDAVCYSPTVDIKPCCVETDKCGRNDDDPANTFKCRADCAKSNEVCYDGSTTPPKTCCDTEDKCQPKAGSNTEFTCQSTAGCAANGETCFDGDNPASVLECCEKGATCSDCSVTKQLLCKCKGDCALKDEACYDPTTDPPKIKSCCNSEATCSVEVANKVLNCSA